MAGLNIERAWFEPGSNIERAWFEHRKSATTVRRFKTTYRRQHRRGIGGFLRISIWKQSGRRVSWLQSAWRRTQSIHANMSVSLKYEPASEPLHEA